MSGKRIIHAPRGNERVCKGWHQEAAMRMLNYIVGMSYGLFHAPPGAGASFTSGGTESVSRCQDRPRPHAVRGEHYGVCNFRAAKSVDALDVDRPLPPKGDHIPALERVGTVVVLVEQHELSGEQRRIHGGTDHDQRPDAGGKDQRQPQQET